jgi:hypothetical protein
MSKSFHFDSDSGDDMDHCIETAASEIPSECLSLKQKFEMYNWSGSIECQWYFSVTDFFVSTFDWQHYYKHCVLAAYRFADFTWGASQALKHQKHSITKLSKILCAALMMKFGFSSILRQCMLVRAIPKQATKLLVVPNTVVDNFDHPQTARCVCIA